MERFRNESRGFNRKARPKFTERADNIATLSARYGSTIHSTDRDTSYHFWFDAVSNELAYRAVFIRSKSPAALKNESYIHSYHPSLLRAVDALPAALAFAYLPFAYFHRRRGLSFGDATDGFNSDSEDDDRTNSGGLNIG